MANDDFFTPENACLKCRKEHTSPSGRFKLAVTPYGTKPGCWSYSRGEVYDGDRLIADIRRNYSSFPFSWIENHPNGHCYLVAGQDYQGQTVVELDTGKRRDFIPKEAEKGAGFCWVAHKFYPENKTLAVEGCIWACPYEFRFYNFSDPMNSGWPEIEIDGKPGYVDADDRWPELDNNTFKCFDTTTHGDDDIDDDVKPEDKPINSTISLKMADGKLAKIDEHISDNEKKRRQQRAKAEQQWQQWLGKFKSEDPLYLKCQELLAKNPSLKKPEYEGWGITHENWCPHFNSKEQRICLHLSPSIDLEWAVETGPIKIAWTRPDKSKRNTEFFEHSPEGMQQAFNLISKILDK